MAKLPFEPIDCQVMCKDGEKCFRRYPSTHRFHLFPDHCPAVEKDPPADVVGGDSSGATSPSAGEEDG